MGVVRIRLCSYVRSYMTPGSLLNILTQLFLNTFVVMNNLTKNQEEII